MLSDPRNGNTGALNKQETNLQSKKIKEDMYVDKTKKKKKEIQRGLGVAPSSTCLHFSPGEKLYQVIKVHKVPT